MAFNHRLLTIAAASLVLLASYPSSADVPLAPTADDALPAAITGAAGPLRGSEVDYYPGNVKTRGYLAVPDAPGPHGAVILIHEWNGLVQPGNNGDLADRSGYALRVESSRLPR